jgi:pimeloyl-ACP methyl ester carboxylesterase
MPVLAVGAGGGDFTYHTMSQVADQLSGATLEGVGHYPALEAPAALAEALLGFYRTVESRGQGS